MKTQTKSLFGGALFAAGITTGASATLEMQFVTGPYGDGPISHYIESGVNGVYGYDSSKTTGSLSLVTGSTSKS